MVTLWAIDDFSRNLMLHKLCMTSEIILRDGKVHSILQWPVFWNFQDQGYFCDGLKTESWTIMWPDVWPEVGRKCSNMVFEIENSIVFVLVIHL